ncbi:MAG: CGGC domain-containing protein [Lachnospiraceae bacterium]|nr:CGGC domain-containing protein [Lachnospiraceae bacterium]
MNKIGILTCIHSNNVCARVGCLAAFQNRTDFFQDYPEDTCLAAMMTCNGCKGANPIEPIEDKGILEKIDRLVSEKISTIHVGVCRLPDGKHECLTVHSVHSNVAKIHSRLPAAMEFWLVCLGILAY